MSAPVLALSALAVAYLEARTLISEDLRTIISAAGKAIPRRRMETNQRVNFFYILEALAKSTPNKVAMIYPRQVVKTIPIELLQSGKSLDHLFVIEKYTYKEVYDTSLRYAAVLKNKYNIDSNSSVALNCMNRPEFVFVWFAVWSLGALNAFINYNLTGHSLLHCLETANATLMLVDSDPEVSDLVIPYEDAIKDLNCRIAYLNGDFEELVNASQPYRAPDSARHPEHLFSDAAILIYTSGTTGLPKPAIMSWKKILLSSHVYACAIQVRPTDVLYSAMPLYHSTAAVLGIVLALNQGATFVVGHKFSSSTFWTQVKLSKATYIQYVGETCRYLLNAPPSVDERAHHVVCAYGNGMRPDVWDKFKKRFCITNIGEFYAATESPTGLSNFQSGERGVGAVGRYGSLLSWIMLSLQHAIVKMDPENETQHLRNPKTGFCVESNVNEPGELLSLISPATMKEEFQGYYGNDKASEEKIVRNVFKKGDIYYRTGDLLRRDKNNMVYFVDRLGDTFRWKSENVSTNEVEEIISEFGGEKDIIGQVVVVGVQIPQHEGRAGFAVIAPKDLNKLPDPQELAHHLISELPRYAVPIFIKFVEAISTTGNNKIQKAVYRKQKFPNMGEQIWWLDGDTYIPLEQGHWDLISSGKIKL